MSGQQHSSLSKGRQMLRPSAYLLSCLVGAALCAPQQPSAAQPAGTIDKPVTIYVAGTAGGGIDLYARVVGRHLGHQFRATPR